MLAHHLRRLCWAAAAVAFVAFAATGESGAQGKGNKGSGTSPFHTILTELHATHHLLSIANHDYKGHRAAAHAAVGKAIHMLQTHPHHHHHAKSGSGGKGLPAVHEAQQLSDAQLQQAAKNLQVIYTQLAAMQTTPLAHPNIAAAGGHLQTAVQQIQTALKVSPQNK